MFHSGYITKVKNSPSYYKVLNEEVLYYFSKNIISAYLTKKAVSLDIDSLDELSTELGSSLKDIQAFNKALVNLAAKLPEKGEKNEACFNTLVAGGIMLYSIFQQKATHYVSVEVSIISSTGDRGIIDNLFYPY